MIAFKAPKRALSMSLAVILLIGAIVAFFVINRQRIQPVSLHSHEPQFTKNLTAPAANPRASKPASSLPPLTAARSIWIPAPVTSWQWQLSTPVDLSVNAQMYDIDLFSNDASVVSQLHAVGRKAVCYISVGSFEDWRPDAGQFPTSVIGNDYVGWPGEKWLDIRRIDILGPIIQARFDQCRDKGFDGIEPDNIHGYSEDTGFAISYQDQLAYNRWLADQAHRRGLSIGLKSDRDQAGDLVGTYDWALDEECHEFQECDKLTPFTQAGKAVFNTEYVLTPDQFCTDANARNFNAIYKHKELDAYRQSCR